MVKGPAKCALAMVVLLCKAGCPGTPSPEQPVLSTEDRPHSALVDGSGVVGAHNSLALDTWGKPYISYYDRSRNQVRLAAFGQDSWSSQPVASLTGSTGMVPTALCMDQEARPHLVWFHRARRSLEYAQRTGQSWAVRTLFADNLEVRYLDLVVQSKELHVAYYDSHRDQLFYASSAGTGIDSGEWQRSAVDERGNGRYLSLAVDSQGTPHLAYYSGPKKILKYARKDGGVWRITEIGGPKLVAEDVGRHCDLTLDQQERPHISFGLYLANGVNGGDLLGYTFWGAPGWSFEIVSTEASALFATRLAIDPWSRPHIVFIDDVGKKNLLRHSWFDGFRWRSRSVDPGAGRYSSMAVDSVGQLHVSFNDSARDTLRYATLNWAESVSVGPRPAPLQREQVFD